MTSQIAAETIDEDFPVADQDNDSQGFRDNFSVIKNSLLTAAGEISDLQTNSARLGSDENNDFRGGIISNVQLLNAYKIKAEGAVSNNQIVVDNAYYFVVNKVENGPIVIEWPDNENNNYIEVMLEVVAPEQNTGTVVVSFGGDVKSNFDNQSDPVSTAPGVNIHLTPGEIAFFKCWITAENLPGLITFVQFIDKFQ